MERSSATKSITTKDSVEQNGGSNRLRWYLRLAGFGGQRLSAAGLRARRAGRRRVKGGGSSAKSQRRKVNSSRLCEGNEGKSLS